VSRKDDSIAAVRIRPSLRTAALAIGVLRLVLSGRLVERLLESRSRRRSGRLLGTGLALL